MDEYVPFDELRLTFRVPTHLDEKACEAIRRILESRPFRVRLRRSVRQILQRHPELEPVRLRISG